MKQVRKFIREFNISNENLTIKKIEEILIIQGYNIYNFGPNEDITNEVLKRLNLEEMAKTKNAFTYSNEDIKAVFIKKNIATQEYLEVLKFSVELKRKLKYNEKILFSIFIVISIITMILIIQSKNENLKIEPQSIPTITTTSTTTTIEEIVYITKTGKKYHRKDCYTIKNKEVIEISKKEAIEISKKEAIELYDPCKICNP